jgi:hypothetical protein
VRGVILDPTTGRPDGFAEDVVREHDETNAALREELRQRGLHRVVESLEKGDRFPDIFGTKQDFESLVPANISGTFADLTAVTATSETALWTPSLALAGIPAWDAQPGRFYILRSGGVITTTTANATVTPRFGTTTGGVTFGASAAVALTASQTGVAWTLDLRCFIRSCGTAASTVTAVATGQFTMGTMAMNFGGLTITTGDNSITAGLFVGWTFSAASQSITPKYVVQTSAG